MTRARARASNGTAPIKYSRRRHLLMRIIFVRTSPRVAPRRVIRMDTRARVTRPAASGKSSPPSEFAAAAAAAAAAPRRDFVNISARKY
jgi:hypothetical protein